MTKKISEDKLAAFWSEYSTNIMLGVIEDTANRTRLAMLPRFSSSGGRLASLAKYVKGMKDKRGHVFYTAGHSADKTKGPPFVEGLLKKGYQVHFLTEAVNEFTISVIPEFDGSSIDGDTEATRASKEKLEPLVKWMGEDALKDHILRTRLLFYLEARLLVIQEARLLSYLRTKLLVYLGLPFGGF